jgi:hypothetical protein
MGAENPTIIMEFINNNIFQIFKDKTKITVAVIG